MSGLGARIATEFPASNNGWGVVVERYADTLDWTRHAQGAPGVDGGDRFVLLIGCANLANLALTRGLSREREVVVAPRWAPGAGR